jgi:SAM-dependent methyltransferase
LAATEGVARPPEGKWSSAETRAYWERLHGHARDELAAVCHPASGRLHNGLSNYSDRLGMRWALARVGPLRGQRVLDLGVGRARWARRFAAAGATVVGLDLSLAALAAQTRPRWQRLAGTAAALPLQAARFDLVSSVTVVQHVPADLHAAVFAEIARVLRPGGHAVLLERVGADPQPHTMPHTTDGWAALGEQAGLRLVARHWTDYELAIMAYWRLRAAVVRAAYAWRGEAAPSLVDPTPGRGAWPSRLDWTTREAAAALSWPLEPACFALDLPLGTHMAYVFAKP